MSRICVKNLPRYVTDENLRKHFAPRGEVTDAKIVKTRDGRSRQFGYVGFRTEEEATAAVKYFHRTFFDNSRISCEVAQAVGDPNLPRPWSRHSEGSSAFQKSRKAKPGSSLGSDSVQQGQTGAENGVRGKQIFSSEENDPQLAEFLEVMQARRKSKLWANDTVERPGTSCNAKKGVGRTVKVEESSVEGVLRRVPIGKGKSKEKFTRLHVRYDDDSDEEVENSIPNSHLAEVDRVGAEDGEADQVGAVIKDEAVSDLDYLKSRTKVDWRSDDEGEDENNKSSDAVRDDKGGTPETDHSLPEVVPAVDHTKGNEEKHVSGMDKPDGWEAAEADEVDNRLSEGEKDFPLFDDEDGITETGRLFVRNLPYTASEEDLRELFSKFGELSQVHLVLDRETKRSKGLAFVLFILPEAAVRAMEELDKNIFQGRLLHIMPAKRPGPVPEKEQTVAAGLKTSKFAQKKLDERKAAEAGGNTSAWNAFFVNPDTVAESVAQQYGMSKGDFLDPEADDLAVRLALGETHIIAETKRALSREGVNVELLEKLASEGEVDTKRSSHIILVKNLPFSATQGELVKIFNGFGTLGRIVLPPMKTLALIEFLEAADARRAFKGLAYKRFKHVPLYLEWAPDNVLMKKPEGGDAALKGDGHLPAAGSVKHLSEEQLGAMDLEEDLDVAQARSLFVKNLNFSTSESDLKKHIRQHVKTEGAIRSVKINAKPSKAGKPLSMGFGFVEFDTGDTASEMCQLLQGTVLDGHSLVVQLSHRSKSGSHPKSQELKPIKADKKASSTKIIMRNVAFEATKKDLRQLVSPFGQIKSLRLPKKFDGNHRGFAFIEFVTRQEAQNAVEALQNTHLYGRHLVLERAKEGETLDDLRARTLKQLMENEFAENVERPAKKRRQFLGDIGISFSKAFNH